MDDRDAVAWLHRRAGFGLPPDELESAAAAGAEAELERLLDPSGAGGRPSTDFWDDAQLPLDPRDAPSRTYAISAWMRGMVTTTQPLLDRLAWFWHGHFTSGLDKVRVAKLMVGQIRLYRTSGLGRFRDLLRAVTIDPAMLVYLDLRTSTGDQPNENYAREVMELFTLGVGAYREDDVKAAARALTGWRVSPSGTPVLRPGLHDDSPQTYLGASGVHDLDTVVDAIMASPDMPSFVAGAVARDLLGPVPQAVVDRLASGFSASGFDVREMVRATLREGLAGNQQPVALAPVPWLVIAARVTGSRPQLRNPAALLRTVGQVPMAPPNVAGWPGGTAWFGTSSLVVRADLAAAVAAGTPEGPVLSAARGADHAALAAALGLASTGFGAASAAALDAAPSGTGRLAVALMTPEFLIA